MGGAAAGGKIPYGPNHRAIGRKGIGMHLGISAAQVKSVHVVGKAGILNGRKAHRLASVLGKSVKQIGIVKMKGCVIGHGKANRRAGRRRGGRWG